MPKITPKVSENYQIIEEKLVYNGFFKLTAYQLKHRLFNGQWSSVLTREVLQHPGAVAILPYDPIAKKVVLVEQFRAGALNDSNGPWLFELPAGLIEPNEPLAEVAKRETQEETGAPLLDIFQIGQFWLSPGSMSEQVTLFCGCIKHEDTVPICGLAEEDEDIKVHVLDLNEAFAMVDSGKICNAIAMIGLQWLQLHLAEVDERWRA